MENIIKNKEEVSCKYCLKKISKANRKRHEQNCPNNARAVTQNFNCDKCHKTFSRSDSFKSHLQKCLHRQEYVRKRSLLPCSYAECSDKFTTLSLLTVHLRSFHNAPVCDYETLTFESEKNFIDWKKELQNRTFSYLSKTCGNHNSNEGQTKYFYCQQHGSEKPHRSKREANWKTDRRVKHGRKKTGKVCISSMKATYLKDGSVSVVYQATHSHPLNPYYTQFHSLSSELPFFSTEPTMESSENMEHILKIKEKDSCKYCSKEISKRTLKRHEQNCPKNAQAVSQNFNCDQCHKTFNRSDILKSHLKKCLHSQEYVSSESLPEPSSFSEPVMDSFENEKENVGENKYRDICKNRLRENISKILLLLEYDNVPSNILSKLDTEVDTALKCCEILLEDVEDIPKMPASVSFTSNEKLKTQLSQMLSFKRPKKSRKPFDAFAAAAKKKVVSADLLSCRSGNINLAAQND